MIKSILSLQNFKFIKPCTNSSILKYNNNNNTNNNNNNNGINKYNSTFNNNNSNFSNKNLFSSKQYQQQSICNIPILSTISYHNKNNTNINTIINNNNSSNNNLINLNDKFNNLNNKTSPIIFNKNYSTTVSTLLDDNNSNSNNNNNSNNNKPSTTFVNDWISKFPNSVQPYLRLSRVDKPIGVWLLLYPCCWSISLAAPAGSFPDLKTMLVFGIGAYVMRSAGCVINDMADYKFDSKVERTKTRPIASKQLTHKQSLIFLGGQLLASFGLILSSLNYYTIALCASSLPIVVLYPFMKRFTYYPQFVLGLAFNWGALAGYSAIAGSCNWSIVAPLYLAGISWTMVYDTIYAHQDKRDDILVGVKSTALKFAEKSRIILSVFSGLVISGMFLTGIAANMPLFYYLGTAACSSHLIWQLKTVDFNNPSSCLEKFISNKNFGLYFLLIIIVSKLLQDKENENEIQKK
ncbi:4-hydroxybenzoate nonaprenyltransferase [Dictyostelium discoideum AX4]|uniref:4-hydroxybenzoate polyprenyltransferase, mitochondrial n=1 Tax=Dictyostelium discoideum TaxID=44689 RepID=COQ2_DICDI|nr:4-hydroxybenzoate nonaprenyltransferase [Dictyostelium discoideum AX4]Q54U71.1 RecName: Full=4-hydroxybenzoate polyprenyltransferase, mitochondrial; Short=4-HB polyprenyltransferase; AltName: Full=Para-hydroxybenzoate--polyprenyltransferase; Short=PHB:PPT; Short=PHB:polyprenyltransferase [Dictyostelium discoideum]EAL66917.1 4-hydroxybenzoate nonaprenyltransferase [Dictyostelium discoideum AX4]|eukprot:XP_640905.1 4-hydroxybenzoate nonaprenyltransferase [Dictyostelium discoideum AX4]